METLTTKQAVAGGLMIGGFLAFVAILALVALVLGIISGWKILKKAGQPGWKILIPFYNVYIMFKIIGMNFWAWFGAILGISILGSLFGNVTTYYNTESASIMVSSANAFGWIAMIAEAVLEIVVLAIYSARLAHAFKKGNGFAVGIFFLPFIFEMILAFGSAKYDKKAALKK